MEQTTGGFHCSVCDTKLAVHVDAESHMKVDPCPRCIQNALSRGYGDGSLAMADHVRKTYPKLFPNEEQP